MSAEAAELCWLLASKATLNFPNNPTQPGANLSKQTATCSENMNVEMHGGRSQDETMVQRLPSPRQQYMCNGQWGQVYIKGRKVEAAEIALQNSYCRAWD